jgi:hypothetical protein
MSEGKWTVLAMSGSGAEKGVRPVASMTCDAVMGVPKHHLHYCYNVILQTHFTRMRAECRVRHVKRMLQDGNNRHMTLDAIGLSSGFSSATAFRKAFREVTGTPLISSVGPTCPGHEPFQKPTVFYNRFLTSQPIPTKIYHFQVSVGIHPPLLI